MKKQLIQLLAVAAVMLPLQQATAKNYGGFKPGLRFSFFVNEVITSKSVGTRVVKKAKIPNGVPKFRVNQRVKFRIGKRGQLLAKRVNIPFKSDGGSANLYNIVKTGKVTKASTGEVFKNSRKRPSAAALHYVINKYAGFQTTTESVAYTFSKKKKRK